MDELTALVGYKGTSDPQKKLLLEHNHQILGDSGEPTSLCAMMTLQKGVRKDNGQSLSFFGVDKFGL